MNTSSFELDHAFVAVGAGAPEADDLLAAGFEEGPMNVHEGQGTVCRRLFFENVYLELIWLVDRKAASAPAIERTRLAARTGCEEGASRLGLALRPKADREVELPVRTWPYRPPYLPAGMAIPMARSSTAVQEPLLFFMPWERQWSAPRLPHPNGSRTVTAISIIVPTGTSPTPELEWLRQWDGIDVVPGASELLQLEIDGGRQGRTLHLGPATPLEVRW